jgi:biopolymer transport protein ExbD
VAKPPKAFDVWFVNADTVYKGVPYNVVADWTQQGRLAPTDMVRPAGTEVAWVKVQAQEFLTDYIPRKLAARAVPATIDTTQPAPSGVAADVPDPDPLPRKTREAEDDEVDMIPLIDISMVLLVFFIMIRATGALAPVDVPEMKYAGELSNDPSAITISIDKADEFTVIYSVRVGQSPPRPEHDKLATPEAAIAALDALLAETKEPPEVRIACRKDLPNDRVSELQLELEPRQKNKRVINSYVATVIEAPKKQ